MIDLISQSPSASDIAARTPAAGDDAPSSSTTATLTAFDRTPFASITDPSMDGRALLHLFATTGQQEPFEEVVRRYGGMVYNLCHEVTGNRHDAEDATQAAFLSLAVQVKSGQQIQAVGPWLQQVARRMSLDINRARKRRKKREERHGEAWEARQTDARADGAGGAGSHGNPASAAGWEELRHVVQEELNQLPPKYRMPLVLHYYGGLSRDEMAQELNCRANTLGVRLHRGREMLAKRLAKRGVTLSPVIFGVLVTEVVHSLVSNRLVSNTAEAAVLLSAGHPYACGVVAPQIVAMAHDAVRALANAKIKFAAALALLAGGAAAAGAQVVGHVGNWHLPKVQNFDLKGFWDRLFHSTPTRLVDGKPSPTPTKSPDDTAPIVAIPGPPSNPHSERPIARIPTFGGLYPVPIPLGPSNAPIFPPPIGTFNYANRQSPEGFRPPPPVPGAPRLNAPAVATSNGGGGAGGGNSGGNESSNDNAVNPDKRRPPRGANDNDGLADRKNNNSRDNGSGPDRGGVKQLPGGNGNKPSPGGSTGQPDSFDPGEITHPSPSKWPTAPGSKLGPGVVEPPTPPGDANHNGPAPNQGSENHGGFNYDGNLHVDGPDASTGQGPSDTLFTLGPNQELVSREVVVGGTGTGVANQTGGTHTVDSVYLGVIKTGHGTYQLTGGELRITAGSPDPDAPRHALEVGTAGEGLFLLGNATSTGQITQVGQGTGVDLTVGVLRNAKGTLRGWGAVSLTGTLTNNGQIIADGYGQDRTLDLSSFATVTSSYLNATTRGWLATNKGRLQLPAIAVTPGTNSYNWGAAPDDQSPSLVNSVRLTFHEAQTQGLVNIALLALDRDDVPTLPTGHHFIGVWSYDATGIDPTGGTDLLVRYDDTLAATLGLDENVLKLWKYEDGQWLRLDHDATFLRDPSLHTLFVHTDLQSATFFAVSAPEPTTIALLTGGLSLLTLHRRRRRRPL